MNAYKCHIAPEDYRATYYESTVVIASTIRKAAECFERENPTKCLKAIDEIAKDVLLASDPPSINHLHFP